MPAVAPSKLINAVLEAFADSGCQSAITSGIRHHPRIFRVIEGGQGFDIWVYIWTITHGGATRSANEFRIQMTSVSSPLPLNPSGPTVLLGWEPERDVFCGFDLGKHRTFTTGSPSVQVSLPVLEGAITNGFSFGRKSNDEITVGFRRDQILNYVVNADRLHTEGAQVQELLQRLAESRTVPAAEISTQPEERRRVVETVSKLVRDVKFRDNVLGAYGHKCAVSGVQLKLLDAAHILPVGAAGSIDHVTNGLALGPTYHRAFDRGLIFLTEDLRMVVNQAKITELSNAGRGGGVQEFSIKLNQPIQLPARLDQRPSAEMIRRANAFRRVNIT